MDISQLLQGADANGVDVIEQDGRFQLDYIAVHTS